MANGSCEKNLFFFNRTSCPCFWSICHLSTYFFLSILFCVKCCLLSVHCGSSAHHFSLFPSACIFLFSPCVSLRHSWQSSSACSASSSLCMRLSFITCHHCDCLQQLRATNQSRCAAQCKHVLRGCQVGHRTPANQTSSSLIHWILLSQLLFTSSVSNQASCAIIR